MLICKICDLRSELYILPRYANNLSRAYSGHSFTNTISDYSNLDKSLSDVESCLFIFLSNKCSCSGICWVLIVLILLHWRDVTPSNWVTSSQVDMVRKALCMMEKTLFPDISTCVMLSSGWVGLRWTMGTGLLFCLRIWLILEIPEIWTFVIVTDQSELRQIWLIVTDQSELFPQIWVNPVSDIFSERW